MRGIAFRRHMQDKLVIKRLKRLKSWRRFSDANGIRYQHCTIKQFIGTDFDKMYKTYTTVKSTSSHKIKYSPNSTHNYWRDRNRKGNRETDKVEFFKILKLNGIR